MNTRQLNPIFKAIGGDPTSEQPDLDSRVTPVYVLDDLTGALPNRGSAKILVNFLPAGVAAQLGTVEITPAFGMWIRAFGPLVQNTNFALTPFAPTAITTLQVPNAAQLFSPEASPFQSLGAGRADIWADVNGVTGVQQFPQPRLFQALRMGTTAGSIANSTFFAATTNLLFLKDFWVAAGVTLQLQAIAVNAQPSWYLELEFPSQCCGPF